MKTTVILDAGHGGISPGELYLTKGKQSPYVPPGIYEGEFNQAIVERLEHYMEKDGIPHVALRPGAVNIPLKSRIAYANELHKRIGGNTVFLSIHANAQRLPWGAWGDANGNTVFHYRFSKEGERLATILSTSLRGMWKEAVGIQSRGVKKSFWMGVLRKTKMPAVLIECGFMTNRVEANLLRDEYIRDQIAYYIYAALQAWLLLKENREGAN